VKHILCFLLLQQAYLLNAQVTAPCGNDYGSDVNRANIQQQMFTGTVSDVATAIQQAKETRGISLGCPQVEYGPFNAPNITEPTLSSIANVWNSGYRPTLEAYVTACPEPARGMPRYGFAALYARMAGYYSNLTSLEQMGNMLEAQQYSTQHAPEPLATYAGMFGYYHGLTGDPCQLSGVVGTSVDQFCNAVPSYCIPYNAGLYSGETFVVNDHIIQDGNILGDIGGAGYDQGWAVAFLVENAIQQTDPIVKQRYRDAAVLGAEWCIQHPLVTNHNYTAKLVWALAQLYAWTGRSDFKAALIDRLDRNLCPGILTDWDQNGMVDNMNTTIAFSSLYASAQTPGRNWDAHNAQPWYQSMIAWALTEAYVAFRDRGDIALAAQYKPYALLVTDNLATEILQRGVMETNQTGWVDTPHALLLACWKIARYENENHSNWFDAIWAIWNSGVFNTLGDRGFNIPLYLLLKENIAYVPLAVREEFPLVFNTSTSSYDPIKLYPQPAQNQLKIELDQSIKIQKWMIYSIDGKLISSKILKGESSFSIELPNINNGMYFIELYSQNQGILSKRFQVFSK